MAGTSRDLRTIKQTGIERLLVTLGEVEDALGRAQRMHGLVVARASRERDADVRDSLNECSVRYSRAIYELSKLARFLRAATR